MASSHEQSLESVNNPHEEVVDTDTCVCPIDLGSQSMPHDHTFTMGQFSQSRGSTPNVSKELCTCPGPQNVYYTEEIHQRPAFNFQWERRNHHQSQSSLAYRHPCSSQNDITCIPQGCHCHNSHVIPEDVRNRVVLDLSLNEPKICQIRKIECHVSQNQSLQCKNRKQNQSDGESRLSGRSTDQSHGEMRYYQKAVDTTSEISISDPHCRKSEIQEAGELRDSRLEAYRKNNESSEIPEEDRGPPLPPRPPPRPRGAQGAVLVDTGLRSSGGQQVRKYVLCCLLCGGLAVILGVLFLGVYFLLRSYTSTVGYFETVPTFVPATLLILTGVCVMSLARRRNRYSYLIKVSGACGIVCALTCALVTVTTTVLHMGRLQTLRECEYTQRTRTCTCYSVLIESHGESDEGVRFVFDATPDCGVVHGALYSCLRGVFGLSVAGILVCVFCCMLVYQLLSHERKKMYWEQLELRCRSLYQQPGAGPGILPTGPMCPMGGPLVGGNGPQQYCRCCEPCRYPTGPPTSMGVYPWDGIENRFWTPGQAGNFYSPNPGEESGAVGQRSAVGSRGRAPSGWSWPRLPWSRSDQRYRQTPSSPDSQYGFSNSQNGESATGGGLAAGIGGGSGGYSVIGGPPYGPWGPPPPYSDPNSPARRGRYTHVHSHPVCVGGVEQRRAELSASAITGIECAHSNTPSDSFCTHRLHTGDGQARAQHTFKFTSKENYENAQYDSTTVSDSQTSDGNNEGMRVSTLPVRKTKKRVDISSVKSVADGQASVGYRTNVKTLFSSQKPAPLDRHDSRGEMTHTIPENDYNEPLPQQTETISSQSPAGRCVFVPRLKGVENVAFQTAESGAKQFDPTESEMYFADVSSCCNISVKNDHFYEDCVHTISEKCTNKQKEVIEDLSKTLHNRNLNKISENVDYLAKRFGKREPSVRSRLPFPQTNVDDLNFNQTQVGIHQKDPVSSVNTTPISENTDFTDLSPGTPGFTEFPPDFSQSFPHMFIGAHYSSSGDFISQRISELGENCRTSSNLGSETVLRLHDNEHSEQVFLAPDAQYDIITDIGQQYLRNQNGKSLNYESTNGNFQTAPCFGSNSNTCAPQVKQKKVHISDNKRTVLGTNISSIIQNLGGSDLGLLYQETTQTNEQSNDSCDDNHKQLCCYGDTNINLSWHSDMQ